MGLQKDPEPHCIGVRGRSLFYVLKVIILRRDM